jgi:hypothetical protein
MFDPILGLSALAVSLLFAPSKAALDPGPSPNCPKDMRLVEGKHYDDVQHLCLEPRADAKDTHCFAYLEGFTALEGEVTDVRVCMDRFEAPNRRGEKALVMQSYEDGARWCKKRGKRMCTEAEWEMACEGPDYRALAYGWKVQRSTCNSDKGWRPFDLKKLAAGGDEQKEELERLWQGAGSGEYSKCVSPYGVQDLMGNVEEWVTSRKERRWRGVLRGGFWAKPWTGCRGANDAHETTFTFYETGFRCCSEPKATPADAPPSTP